MSKTVSETAVKRKVYSFCKALASKNMIELQDLLTDGAVLSWGPYDFKGKEGISIWAKELFELFPFMSFKEKSFEDKGTIAKHEFMIAFLTASGQKGWLPCIANYSFEDGRVNQLKVNLLHGFLSVTREDLEKVKPHAPKQ